MSNLYYSIYNSKEVKNVEKYVELETESGAHETDSDYSLFSITVTNIPTAEKSKAMNEIKDIRNITCKERQGSGAARIPSVVFTNIDADSIRAEVRIACEYQRDVIKYLEEHGYDL